MKQLILGVIVLRLGTLPAVSAAHEHHAHQPTRPTIGAARDSLTPGRGRAEHHDGGGTSTTRCGPVRHPTPGGCGPSASAQQDRALPDRAVARFLGGAMVRSRQPERRPLRQGMRVGGDPLGGGGVDRGPHTDISLRRRAQSLARPHASKLGHHRGHSRPGGDSATRPMAPNSGLGLDRGTGRGPHRRCDRIPEWASLSRLISGQGKDHGKDTGT
jgi:hypothetical protein